MIRVDQTIGSDKRIPFSVVWTSAGQVAPKTQIRNAESDRHKAVRELNSHRLSIGRRMYVFPGGR